MATQIFVNLPVKDLNKTIEFFTKLGFKFNPQFTNEDSSCMIIGEDSFVMLLREEFFKNFTRNEIADATKSIETIISLSAESKEKVNEMAEKVIQAGGTIYSAPQDLGWIYKLAFQDLDGHQWEILYLDLALLQKQNENAAVAQKK